MCGGGSRLCLWSATAQATVANLELLRNLRTGDTKSSLFGALNHVTAPKLHTWLTHGVVLGMCVCCPSRLTHPLSPLSRAQCITTAGARYLRSNLIQPSTDLATIAARLDAVSELLARPEALQDARKV